MQMFVLLQENDAHWCMVRVVEVELKSSTIKNLSR